MLSGRDVVILTMVSNIDSYTGKTTHILSELEEGMLGDAGISCASKSTIFGSITGTHAAYLQKFPSLVLASSM